MQVQVQLKGGVIERLEGAVDRGPLVRVPQRRIGVVAPLHRRRRRRLVQPAPQLARPEPAPQQLPQPPNRAQPPQLRDRLHLRVRSTRSGEDIPGLFLGEEAALESASQQGLQHQAQLQEGVGGVRHRRPVGLAHHPLDRCPQRRQMVHVMSGWL